MAFVKRYSGDNIPPFLGDLVLLSHKRYQSLQAPLYRTTTSLLLLHNNMSKETEASTGANPPDSDVVERHRKFYFADGNIVLSAYSSELVQSLEDEKDETSDGSSNEPEPSPETTRKILFRVHKSILQSASQVFADMLGLSEGEASELYDEVPLVHMPDPAEDIEAMLDMLYGSSFTRL